MGREYYVEVDVWCALRDRKCTAKLLNPIRVCVDEVVTSGRLRWYGHVERKDMSDLVSTCRELQLQGTKCKGIGRKTWNECVKALKVDTDRLALINHDAHNQDKWRSSTTGNCPTLLQCDNKKLINISLLS